MAVTKGARSDPVGGRPVVGRDDLLARLTSTVDDCLAGRSGALLLAGEAGIGKTTLLSAAARHGEAGGARTGLGWGWPGEGAPGYWVWLQALRDLGLEGPLTAARRQSTVDDGASARFELFDAVCSALLEESRIQPLLLVLDDLQWADPSSLQLLGFVLRRMPAGALAVLGAYRDVDPAPGPELSPLTALCPVVRLGGLGVDAVERLVADAAGERVASQVAVEVHRRTGGNPFFVQQVAWLLPAGLTGLPPGVDEVLRQRFAGLPPECVRALWTAAAIGPRADRAILAAATGTATERVPALLAPAIAARIVVDDAGDVRFAHDLLREYAYELVAPQDRPDVHQRIATAMAAARSAGAEVTLAEIAEQVVHADPTSAQAYETSVAAATDAIRRRAYEEAVRHWQHASVAAGGERAATMLALAGAARQAAAGDTAAHAYRRAAERARRDGDADALGEAALGLHALGTRAFASATDLVALHEEALATMERTPRRLRVLASLARLLAWHGVDGDHARSLSAEAVAAARAAGDLATLAACLLARHHTLAGPASAPDRLELVGELLAIAARPADTELAVEARLLAAHDRLELGDPAFRSELDEFLRLAEGSGVPRLRYAAIVRRTLLALLAGRIDDAERLIAEAVSLGEQCGEDGALDVHFEHSWDVATVLGRRGGAIGLVQQAFPDATTPEGRGMRALVLLASGARDEAMRLAQPLLESPPGPVPDAQWLVTLAYAAEVVAALGARAQAQAEELYDVLIPHAHRVVVSGVAVSMRGAVAHHVGLLAEVMDRPQWALAHLRRAVEIHEALGASAWALRSRFELARIRLTTVDPIVTAEDRATALADLQDLAGQLRRLGMVRLADAAEQLAFDAGAGAASAVFRRVGTLWTITYAGTTIQVPDAKGLRDLAVLLAAPGRPVAAADLVAASAATRVGLGLGADEVLDETARRQYRRRLGQLAEEIEDAEASADLVRAQRARDEREALLEQLGAATGLGGRSRLLGDQGERARKAVTARIRDSLRRIDQANPALGAHLSASVSTGAWCVYAPPTPVTWRA